MKFIASIEEKLKDQEIKAAIRVFGSMLVALSGLILFTDKVTSFELADNYGFKSTKTFIWVLCQSLSPFILLFSLIFKPYKTSFLIPIYIYTIQVYWVFKPSIQFDDYLLQVYAIGTCCLFIFLTYAINKMKYFRNKQIQENKVLIEEAKKTLELLKNEMLKSA